MDTVTTKESLQCFKNTSVHVNVSGDIPECISTASQNYKFFLIDQIWLHPCFITLLH